MREERAPGAARARGAADGAARAAESDESLAAAGARGDRAAFGVLVDRYAERVFRFVRARVRDRHDAEEVTQEAFLRAWGAIDRFDGTSWRFSTWLYTIARREAVNVVRSRAAARRTGAANGVALRPVPSAGAPGRETEHEGRGGARVWDIAAGALGCDEYEAVWLRYAEDRTPAEIGVILGRSAVAVRVMLHRARVRLRARLEEAGRDRP